MTKLRGTPIASPSMRRMRAQTAWKVPSVMPRADAAEQRLDAVAQLARRLVGEGDGHDAAGRHALLADQVGDAVGDDARLAAAGPGEDQQRPFGVDDGVVLGGVEAFEDGHSEAVSTGILACAPLPNVDTRSRRDNDRGTHAKRTEFNGALVGC